MRPSKSHKLCQISPSPLWPSCRSRLLQRCTPLAVRAGKATASPAKEMPSHVRNKAAARGGTVLVKGAVRTPVGQSTAMRGPPLDRVALTRELQRQLQRVGCYGGSISGTWSPSTRRAMKEFTERVNAALPIDKPDAILLAMVQNHEEMTCGAGCPTGQSPAGNGRCLPSAIVARDSAKHAPGTKMRSAKLPSSAGKSRSIGARFGCNGRWLPPMPAGQSLAVWRWLDPGWKQVALRRRLVLGRLASTTTASMHHV